MKKRLMLMVATACVVLVVLADVSVSGVSATQAADRAVTISYTLTDGPAVVTFDALTNGVSIGGVHLGTASGDVWRRIDTDGAHGIKWLPGGDVPLVDELEFRVTAWPTNDPPDYMVVDISAAASTTPKRYYPAVDFLPGGLFGDAIYRTSSVVMRKIPAKGVTWTMGGTDSANYVTFADNYYMGVFEITQAQWRMLAGNNCPAFFTNVQYAAMRPQESVRINNIKFNGVDGTGGGTAYGFPSNVCPTSYMGYLRSRTGIMFNLPSDAQWEYACRARVGEGAWNNGASDTGGVAYTNMPGRCQTTGGGTSAVGMGQCTPAEGGTAVVGSYAPNAWGLYDMHGNVWEICLEWYEDDAAIANYAGATNVNPTNHLQTLSGETGTARVGRGGSWGSQHSKCYSRTRWHFGGGDSQPTIGFRLYCPAEAR